MRNNALTIVLLILIFIVSGCSNNGNTKQLKEDSQLAPFNGEIISYSRDKSENTVQVSDEEWLQAKNKIKQEIDSSFSKLLSTLSLNDFYLVSSMEGKLNNKSFNFDMYGYSDYFSVIVSKYGEQKNIIISATLFPPPSILYDNSVWMSGAKDRHINFNIAAGELGALTTLDNIEKDYPQFKGKPEFFFQHSSGIHP